MVILKNTWSRLALGTAFISVILLLLLPVAGKYSLSKWLLANGAGTVVIDRVKINPFSGTASLLGAKITHNGKTVLSDSTIFFNIGLSTLFHKEGLLQKVLLENVILDIERYEDGKLRVGSYTIPATTGDPAAEPPDPKHKPWIFRALNIEINKTTVTYKQPNLEAILIIDRAEVIKFNTDPFDHAGTMRFTGSINGAPVTFNFTNLRVAPHLEIDGDLAATNLKLDNLSRLLKPILSPCTGTIGSKGAVHFSMSDSHNIEALYNGTLEMQGAAIAGKIWGTKGDTLTWQGDLSYSDGTEQGMHIEIDGELKGTTVHYDMPDPMMHILNSEISIKGKTSVSLASEIRVDSDADIHLTGMDFQLPPWRIHHSQLNWTGQKIGFHSGANKEDPSTVTLNGMFVSKDFIFSKNKELRFNQDEATIKGKSSVEVGKDIIVNYDGDLSLQNNQLVMESLTAGIQSLLWNGKTGYVFFNNGQQQVVLNGKAQGVDIQTKLPEPALQIFQQKITTETDSNLVFGKDLLFSGQAKLLAEGLLLTKEQHPLLALKEAEFVDGEGDAQGGVSIGEVHLKELSLPATEEQPFQIEIPDIRIKKITSPDLHTATVDQLAITQPQLKNTKENTLLAALTTLSVQDIGIDRKPRVTVAGIQLNDGRFLVSEKKDKPVATLKDVQMNNLSWSTEEGLICDHIDVAGLYAEITKETTVEEKRKKQEPAATAAEQSNTPPPKIQINRIAVNGKSGFSYIDSTLDPSFRTNFAVESLTVKDINTGTPEKPLQYQLTGKFNTYSPLDIQGTATPFADKLLLKQTLNLKNYPAQEVSPYVINAIGQLFESGQIGLDSELELAGDEIDMKNSLKLNNLHAKTVNTKLAEKLNNQLPVSLEMALSMLRDQNGDIKLDIPIHGKLSDFRVGFSDILVTALGKALTISITPYLAYTVLGPTGALAYLGLKAGQALVNTNFPKLEFLPGVLDLNEKHQATLDSIGKKIKGETKAYNICSLVSVWELAKEREQTPEKLQELLNKEKMRKDLFTLGEKRALQVKEYLVSTAGIDEKRLLICNPGINIENKAKGTVLIRE